MDSDELRLHSPRSFPVTSFSCFLLLLSKSLWSSPSAAVRKPVAAIDLAAAVDGYETFSSVDWLRFWCPAPPPSLPRNDASFLRQTHVRLRTHTTSAGEAQTARKFLLFRPLLGRASGVKKYESTLPLLKVVFDKLKRIHTWARRHSVRHSTAYGCLGLIYQDEYFPYSPLLTLTTCDIGKTPARKYLYRWICLIKTESLLQ